MSITIDFTFDDVTPESAEHGDVERSGFIMPGMWRFDGSDDQYERCVWKLGDLAGIIAFARSLGIVSDGDNFYSVDPDVDYRTGTDTTYAMHVDGMTPSTEARIHSLLGAS